MKFWKKILLILSAVFLLAQIPFVCTRFQNGKISEKINLLQNERVAFNNTNFNEYKGIIHAHTLLGGHSTGTYEELLAAARRSDLDFVVMTEHFSENYDTSALTLNGFYGKTLFVGGNEIDTASGDRFLLIPGSFAASGFAKQTTGTMLEKIHSENKFAFVTYPEKFKSWNADFDGIEVFSLHTNAKKMNPATFFFDAVWSYGKYPELTLARYFARPEENLQRFDEMTAIRRRTLFAGSDAHSNLGFHIIGDDAGNKLVNFKFDGYETIFRLVRTHILLENGKSLTRENLLEALKKGNCFVGFDVLSDTTGFSFTAENGAESRITGDEIALGSGVRLRANAPLAARFIIFKNGAKVFEAADTTEANFHANEAGNYRVEVYLDSLSSAFGKIPWIISNPIYIR